MNYLKQTYFYITLQQSKYNPYIVSILQFKTWPPNPLGNSTCLYVTSKVLEVVKFIDLYTIIDIKVRTLVFLTQFIVFIDYHLTLESNVSKITYIKITLIIIFRNQTYIYIYIYIYICSNENSIVKFFKTHI
jgi:hypothetical protein